MVLMTKDELKKERKILTEPETVGKQKLFSYCLYMGMHKFHLFIFWGKKKRKKNKKSQNIKEMISSLDSGVTKNCLII